MKKTIMILSVVAVLFIVVRSFGVLSPLESGVAEKYVLTFKTFALQNDAGDWTTVNSTESAVDIASVGGGQLASTIAGGSGVDIPQGHYKAFRSVVSGTVTIKGYAVGTGVNAGKIFYTTAATTAVSAPPGQSPDGFGSVCGTYTGTEAAFLAPATTPAAYAECTLRPPTVGDTITTEMAENINVTAGTNPKTEQLDVDLNGTIQVWDIDGNGTADVIFPGAPNISAH